MKRNKGDIAELSLKRKVMTANSSIVGTKCRRNVESGRMVFYYRLGIAAYSPPLLSGPRENGVKMVLRSDLAVISKKGKESNK